MAEALQNESVFTNDDVTRIIKISNFSKTKNGDKIRDEEIFHKCKFVKLLQIRVYPAGKGKENKDYVSAVIRRRWIPQYPLSYQCTVSVINVHGKPKSYQSFGHRSSGERQVEDVGLVRYISRQALLQKADKLLPNDTLTLQFELSFTVESSSDPLSHKFLSALNLLCEMFPKADDKDAQRHSHSWVFVIETKEGDTFPLKFQSGKRTLGSDVLKESPVIRRMLETPMVEKSSGEVRLKDVDCQTLSNFLIYVESKKMVAKTMEEACKLYEMADEYGVLNLMKECARYIAGNLKPLNVAELSVLAYKHNDQQLMAAIANRFRTKDVLFLQSSIVTRRLFGESQKIEAKKLNSKEDETIKRGVRTLFEIAQDCLNQRSKVLYKCLEEVYVLFEIANTHRSKGLMLECCRWLGRNIIEENVEMILNLATAYNDKVLLASVAGFINGNKNTLLDKGYAEIVTWLNEWSERKEMEALTENTSLPEHLDPQSLEDEEILEHLEVQSSDDDEVEIHDQYEFYK